MGWGFDIRATLRIPGIRFSTDMLFMVEMTIYLHFLTPHRETAFHIAIAS